MKINKELNKALGMIMPILVLLCLLVTSCAKKPPKSDATIAYSDRRRTMEEKAQASLQQSRSYLSKGDLDKARNVIKQMRKDCYLALNARKQGILLMDSIDLQQSKNELVKMDSIMHLSPNDNNRSNFDEACRKVQFYERKLQYDKQQSK